MLLLSVLDVENVIGVLSSAALSFHCTNVQKYKSVALKSDMRFFFLYFIFMQNIL